MTTSTTTSNISMEVLVCERPGCSRRNSSLMCSRCNCAYYCSDHCQRRHWLEHKKTCHDHQTILEEYLGKNYSPVPPPDAACAGCRSGTLEYPMILACSHWICLDCLGRSFSRGAPILCPTCHVTSEYDPRSACNLLLHQVLHTFEHGHLNLRPDEQSVLFDRTLHVTDNVLGPRGEYYVEKPMLLIKSSQGAKALEMLQQNLTKLIDRTVSTIQSDRALDARLRRSLSEEARQLGRSFSLQQFYHVISQVDGGIGIFEYAAKFLLLKGQALEQLHLWSDGVQIYKDLRHCAASLQVELGLARCQLNLNDLEAAEASVRTAFQEENSKGDKQVGIHKVLAQIQQADGKLEEACQTMQHALYYEEKWHERNYEENVKYLGDLRQEKRRIEEDKRREESFVLIWGETIDAVREARASGVVGWADIKRTQFDMFAEEENDDDAKLLESTTDRLQAATSAAIRVDDDEVVLLDEDLKDDNVIIDRGGTKTHLEQISELAFDRFKLTKEVRKWWDQGDPKYKDFFARRLRQLAAGDRSRILQKRLTGSKKTTIFETYLEQKSGFRILWTEATNEDDNRGGIIIWYVSPHDRVSAYMRRIDEAESRSMRQLTTVAEVPELQSALVDINGDEDEEDGDLRHDQVLLDPFGDVPLKLFMLRYDDLPRMLSSKWKPQLNLTSEERRIVEKEGTVLLLGRSGTGKTLCISNRMDHDRHLAEGDPSFSQLFVARSRRICANVEDIVGSLDNFDDSGASLTSFKTFRSLLEDCETRLSDLDHEAFVMFDPQMRIDYRKFKRYFAGTRCELEPLNVWTQIRSFIKGSIEAVLKGAALSREEFMNTEKIGSRRCRLSLTQRDLAYTEFEKYEMFKQRSGLWDDCDRITRLVRSLLTNQAARECLSRRRVYVDEIQDFTQAEIALFFLICDCGGLFFAGDPAQSVVEGVEFRFEEVRSVAWHLYPDDTRYIPEKPLTVTRNFRSHAGILNVAAEVLDRLFAAFPGSAKGLPKDEGLFRGPRPTIFLGIDLPMLTELVVRIPGVWLLTPSDDYVESLKDFVGRGTVIRSIRESKGLESTDIIIVDFFKTLPPEQQKPWRLLLQGKMEEFVKQPGYPEVETQLKQLYTAITRCIKRLLFVETGSSDAGKAFVRFLCNERKLAIKEEVTDVQQSIKSSDEWASTGVQYGSYAETSEDTEQALYWLDKAQYCFQQSKDKDLERKAHLHQESITLCTQYDSFQSEGVDEGNLAEVVSQHLAKLAGEGLLVEASRFFAVVEAHLDDFTRSALTERLIPFLPKVDEY